MKNIIDIYEGILSDVETRLNTNDFDTIAVELYSKLCNGNLNTHKEGSKMLMELLQNNRVYIGDIKTKKIKGKTYAADGKTDYIEVMPISPYLGYSIKLILQSEDIMVELPPTFPIEKRTARFWGEGQEFMKLDSDKNVSRYIVTDVIRPFINKCLEKVKKIKKNGDEDMFSPGF